MHKNTKQRLLTKLTHPDHQDTCTWTLSPAPQPGLFRKESAHRPTSGPAKAKLPWDLLLQKKNQASAIKRPPWGHAKLLQNGLTFVRTARMLWPPLWLIFELNFSVDAWEVAIPGYQCDRNVWSLIQSIISRTAFFLEDSSLHFQDVLDLFQFALLLLDLLRGRAPFLYLFQQLPGDVEDLLELLGLLQLDMADHLGAAATAAASLALEPAIFAENLEELWVFHLNLELLLRGPVAMPDHPNHAPKLHPVRLRI